MESITKKYSAGDLTVIWKPDQCIHSTVCWKGLKEVFNPKSRPWINMEGADSNRIMEQVARCPSGALSYSLKNSIATPESEQEEITTLVEAMKNGPLMIYGNITVKHADGTETRKSKVTAFCRCGSSANKPFCDGTHIKIGFKDNL
jgi:uncharacterized Fe-S cluster protein YjdI